jgi:hypothetical protein
VSFGVEAGPVVFVEAVVHRNGTRVPATPQQQLENTFILLSIAKTADDAADRLALPSDLGVPPHAGAASPYPKAAEVQAEAPPARRLLGDAAGRAAAGPRPFDLRVAAPRCVALAVADQGACGSSWAIAAARVMSLNMCIGSAGRVNVNLAPQVWYTGARRAARCGVLRQWVLRCAKETKPQCRG